MGDELERFLGEWKHQLEAGEKTGVPPLPRSGLQSDNGELLGKRNDRDESAIVSSEAKRQAREPSPLLVLRSVETSLSSAIQLNTGNRSAPKNHTETLVDTLIADLNELNTIPFFEVQLPREIAIAIFRYLSVKDLCVCARVSKSWRALAEDNVLWSAICQSQGYRNEDVIQWKSVVRKAMVQRRRVRNNWKERICGLNDLRPDAIGRMCCAVYNQNQVFFCCSSGEAYMWDVRVDWGPVELQQSRGADTPTCCDFSDGWAVVGTLSGNLNVMDTQTQTSVHCLRELGHVTSVMVASADAAITVLACVDIVSPQLDVHSDVLVIKSEQGEDWRTFYLELPHTKFVSLQVCKLGFLPHSRSSSLHSHPLPHTVACATSSHGYHVQLFDLRTAAHLTTLKGHLQPVTAINIRQSPPNCIVTGSVDKRVCVYDYARSSQPIMKLHGHTDVVRSVQMNDWKVVSGSADGVVIVWDQRMQSELWRLSERYPVGLCQFDETFLVIGHICSDPVPAGYHGNFHQRQKGLLRVLDFSIDPRHYTTLLPSICSSTYNEPSASFYNLDLVYPYDFIG
ncbi:hypothetical protein EMCRGX_G025064 [Ephydatia muelleri]